MQQAQTLGRVQSKGKKKIWAHSGDSHFIEPKGLWGDILPKALAERMPRIEEVEMDGRPMERIHVDGQVFHFPIPKLYCGIIVSDGDPIDVSSGMFFQAPTTVAVANPVTSPLSMRSDVPPKMSQFETPSDARMVNAPSPLSVSDVAPSIVSDPCR